MILMAFAGTLDAPRLPSAARQRAQNMPAHLALAKDEITRIKKKQSSH